MWNAADLSDVVVGCVESGPLGVAALGLAEKLCPVLPSYVVFTVIGMIVAAHPGDLGSAMLAAAVGSTAGSLCWYGAGRTLGEARSRAMAGRFGRWIHFTPARYQRAVDAFHRHLLIVATIGQTIPAMRVYLAIPAGAIETSLSLFLLGTFVGSLLWSAPLLLLGYTIGSSRSDPASDAQWLVATLLAVEALTMAIWLLLRKRWRQT